MTNPRVAPVVLPASRQHHFRSVGAFDLDVSIAAAEVSRLHRLCRIGLPSNGLIVPSVRTAFSPGPTVRDCSAAAPHTARQAPLLSACPAIRSH